MTTSAIQPSESTEMSNRDTVTTALAKATVATVEELADATRWPERKVRDTLSDLKKLGVVTTERDDVTGKAAYRLADPKATKKTAPNPVAPAKKLAPAVKDFLTAQTSTDQACCNAAAVVATTTAGAEMAFLNQRVNDLTEERDGARTTLQNIRKTLGITPDQSIVLAIENLQRDHLDQIGLIASKLDTAESLNIRWSDAAKAQGPTGPHELRALFSQLERHLEPIAGCDIEGKVAVLVKAPRQTEAFTGKLDAIIPAGYVVITPKKIERFKNGHNAIAKALATARAGKQAKVFSLYPEGRAIKGAEWKPHA